MVNTTSTIACLHVPVDVDLGGQEMQKQIKKDRASRFDRDFPTVVSFGFGLFFSIWGPQDGSSGYFHSCLIFEGGKRGKASEVEQG